MQHAGSGINSESSSVSIQPAAGNWLHQKVRSWEDMRTEKPKTLYHEFLAEVAGTAVVIMFGNGVCASQSMQAAHAKATGFEPGNDVFGSDLFINFGWALGVTFGILMSFESSGAHLNPAVTLSNMIFASMSPVRGFVYMVAQVLGAFLGAVVVTINYVVFKGEDALTNFYVGGPYEGVSAGNAFVQEMICTLLLLAGIFSIASGNPKVNKFHVAGFVGLLILAIGNSFGAQTGFAMNPARDFGPRMAHALFHAIYGKPDLYATVFGGDCGFYWLVPIFAPLVGGPLGALFYKLFNHPEACVEIAPATNAGFDAHCDTC